jgi:hypothetical protein
VGSGASVQLTVEDGLGLVLGSSVSLPDGLGLALVDGEAIGAGVESRLATAQTVTAPASTARLATTAMIWLRRLPEAWRSARRAC